MTVTTIPAEANSGTGGAHAGIVEPADDLVQTYRELAEHLQEGFAYCRAIPEEREPDDFVYLAVNSAFESLTGLKNVVGKRVTEVVPGIRETDPALLRTYARVAQTGAPEKFEVFLEALHKWLSIWVYCPKNGFFVAVFDVITERKQKEKALRESEEAMRALFEDAPLPYHELDKNGIVVRVNRTMCEMLGVDASEMIGRPLWEFVVPEEQEDARVGVARRLLDPASVAIPAERTFRSRTGAEFVFQIHSRRITDAEGNAVGVRTVMIDLAENRRLSARLAMQGDLLGALMDQLPDRIYFKDTESRFTLVNAATVRALGCSGLSQVLGRTDFDFFTQEHAEPSRKDEDDLVHGRVAMVSKEEKETWPDGRETWVHSTKLPLRDGAGEIVGTFGISRDITEGRRMERAFRESQDRLLLTQEAFNLGTWDLDLSIDRAQCSEKLMQLYGRAGDSMDGAQWLSFIHPDDRHKAWTDLDESIRKAQPLSRRLRVVWPDGTVHWLHSMSRVICDAEKRPQRVLGLDFDITELAHNEERLRILSAAVEQSPVSIVITDLQGKIQYVNPMVTETTGYTAEELIGQNPRVLKSGETSAEEYRTLWKTIPAGEWRGTFHNLKKNGELFWESAVIRPIRDASGAPTHYLAVKEDVTAQKATEEALRASEERFRVAAENAGDVVFEWDVATGWFDFLGASIREKFPLIVPPADTAEWSRLIHPEDLGRMANAVSRHFTSHEPLVEDYRMVQTDGSVIDVTVRATIVGGGGAGKFKSIGVVTDITARKAAERVNAELAAVVGSADAAIISRDLSGKVLTWNAGAEHVYGYTAEEMIGRTLDILYPAGFVEKDKAIMENVRSGQAVRHFEANRIRKTGEQVPMLVTASPMRGREGEVIGVAQVGWDMTQVKLLQQQLAQAQKLESLGELAAGIAHEINTPIQYVGDNAQFLASAFQDFLRVIDRSGCTHDADIEYLRGEIPNAFAQLQEGVGRVAGIVRAMKRFSHPGPAEKIPIDIHQAIESTILVSRNEWKYAADLTTDFDPGLPLVPCIAGEFNQVILNLIVNAAHAISDVVKKSGGKGAIRVSTRRNGNLAEIRISDTGGGIPEAIRSKVFDPFFTTKPVGRGTGQGLAIAHSVIVQKHNGAIRFDSEDGKGTTFVIQLPLLEGILEK